MTFTFNTAIPATNNNPSNDQPIMQQNNVSANAILGVDHVTFNTTGPAGSTSGASGGQHLQVTFNGKNVPSAQTDPLSVLYTNNVGATSTNTASASPISSLFFCNQNSGAAVNSFPVSMIRAFGCFDSSATSLNTWNLSASHSSAGVFVLTIPANVVTGTNYLVLVSNTGNAGNTTLQNAYIITSAVQFTLQFVKLGVSFQDPNQFSVVVMQL